MHVFSSLSNFIDALKVSFLLGIRFFLVAGGIFLFLYVWKKKKFWYAKIQQKYPANGDIIHEIKYSAYTLLIFGIMITQVMWASNQNYTLIYRPLDKYGYPYYIFSILLMIVVHDAYFYWTHRLLHWRPIFKIAHKAHHHSLNPTPFSAYCFHPLEALIQGAIYPLIVFTIPYHYSALAIFSAYTLILNLAGHAGYEFFPKGFPKSKILKWHNTPTHHNMHHKFIKCNYGLYFNFWDNIMKTNHPKYEEYYESITDKRNAEKQAVKKEMVETPS